MSERYTFSDLHPVTLLCAPCRTNAHRLNASDCEKPTQASLLLPPMRIRPTHCAN